MQFGFVRTQDIAIPRRNVRRPARSRASSSGLPYIGGKNGQVVPREGFAGAKVGGPIKQPWIALSDLDAGDQQIYVGRGAADGSFDIKNVPDGTLPADHLGRRPGLHPLQLQRRRARTAASPTSATRCSSAGSPTSTARCSSTRNGNGKLDPGERAVPQFALTVRERDNSLMDQATNTATTDDSGTYDIRETYPLGKWLVLEAFNTRYQTTGITYKGENETTATTKLGSAVDLDFLPIIGLGGEIDWGVQPYDPGTNGGIVGTVTYDTTRNELDPADAVTESYQPGIPNVPVHLYVCQRRAPHGPGRIAQRMPAGQGDRAAAGARPGLDPNADPPTALIDNPRATGARSSRVPRSRTRTPPRSGQPPRGCTARHVQRHAADRSAGAARVRRGREPALRRGADDGRRGRPERQRPARSQTVNGNYGFATSKINLYPPSTPRQPGRPRPPYAPLPDG